jgi:hypothetical protein
MVLGAQISWRTARVEMATIAPVRFDPKISAEEAGEQLYRLVESAFDREGLTEEQRDERYSALGRSLDARDSKEL